MLKEMKMDVDPRLTMAAATIQKQEFVISMLVSTMRPFAAAANAQQHTTCGGHIKQDAWELVAQIVAAADRDEALEILRRTPATHAY